MAGTKKAIIPHTWVPTTIEYMEVFIIIGAVLSLLVFVFHTRLYQLYQWQHDFDKISIINQKIFYTINLATTLFLLLFGIISIIYVNELAECKGLAFGFCLAYSLFWLWRAIWQITYFKIPKNVTSKKGIIMNYSLRIVFILLFIAYFIPVLNRVL